MVEPRRDEDERLAHAWRQAVADSDVPDFEQQWVRASAQALRRRLRRGVAIALASAAALIVAFLLVVPEEPAPQRAAMVLADATAFRPDARVGHGSLAVGRLSLSGPTDFLLTGTQLSMESLVVPSALTDTRALERGRGQGGRP